VVFSCRFPSAETTILGDLVGFMVLVFTKIYQDQCRFCLEKGRLPTLTGMQLEWLVVKKTYISLSINKHTVSFSINIHITFYPTLGKMIPMISDEREVSTHYSSVEMSVGLEFLMP
jgi:hypothetical protein